MTLPGNIPVRITKPKTLHPSYTIIGTWKASLTESTPMQAHFWASAGHFSNRVSNEGDFTHTAVRYPCYLVRLKAESAVGLRKEGQEARVQSLVS